MTYLDLKLAGGVNRAPMLPNGRRAVRYRSECDTLLPHDALYENCRAARESGFPILQESHPPRDQPLVLVGSSPNLGAQIGKIARWKQAGAHVAAIKGAHDYLLDHGIVPDSAIATDPQQERARMFPRAKFAFKRAQSEITYYMGSQMDPSTWPRMRGLNVVIWHPAIDRMQHVLPEWSGVKKVYGGSTTGLRAFCLYWILGWREVHAYAMGSHVENGTLRATGEGTFAYDPAFPVCWGGRWFMTTVAMSQQVQDLMPTLQQCPGIRVTAYGDGPLPWVLHCGKLLGWPV